MRLITRTAQLGLAVSLVWSCDGAAPEPTAMDSPPRMLVTGDMELQRLRVDVTSWADLTTTIPVALVTPAAAGNIVHSFPTRRSSDLDRKSVV